MFRFDTLNHERLIVCISKHVNMKATNVSPQILLYLSKKIAFSELSIIHYTLCTTWIGNDLGIHRFWRLLSQCKILLTTNFYFSLFGLRMRWCGYEWCVWDHCKWPTDQCILPSAVWVWLDGRYIYMFILAFFTLYMHLIYIQRC